MAIVKISNCDVIIDDEDIHLLADYRKWFCSKMNRSEKHQCWYCFADKDGKRKYLHRYIFEKKIGRILDKKEIIDHIDHNGLNNSKDNLRIATKGQNCFNARMRATNITGIRGVTFDEGRNAWKAQISYQGNNMFIGRYPTDREAFIAYDAVAKILYKNFHNREISLSTGRTDITSGIE
jgi:hypothetical protein